VELEVRDIKEVLFGGSNWCSHVYVNSGGMVVPILIIGLGLAPRFAIPLGSVTVLGGSLAALCLNLRRRHPLADRPGAFRPDENNFATAWADSNPCMQHPKNSHRLGPHFR